MSKNTQDLLASSNASNSESGKIAVPLLLWVAGVPLSVVILLWFFFFRG